MHRWKELTVIDSDAIVGTLTHYALLQSARDRKMHSWKKSTEVDSSVVVDALKGYALLHCV